MNSWLCKFEDGTETTTEQDSLPAASLYATEYAESHSTTVSLVTLVSETDDALSSGLAKLVALGLTPDEALAVAGSAQQEASPELPPVEATPNHP